MKVPRHHGISLGFLWGISSSPPLPAARRRRGSRLRSCTPWVAAWIGLGALPLPALAQASLGLASVGAVGVHVGTTRAEYDAEGPEGGVLVDFGWVRVPSLRLQGEVALLRATLTERIEVEDRTYRDHFYDLTGSLSLVAMLRDAGRLAIPYVTVGIGVHALSSSFGSIPIDRRFNANPFGSHAGAGLRLRLGAAGGRAVFVELRRTIAEHVDRTSLRAGGLILFNDLRQPTRR